MTSTDTKFSATSLFSDCSINSVLDKIQKPSKSKLQAILCDNDNNSLSQENNLSLRSKSHYDLVANHFIDNNKSYIMRTDMPSKDIKNINPSSADDESFSINIDLSEYLKTNDQVITGKDDDKKLDKTSRCCLNSIETVNTLNSSRKEEYFINTPSNKNINNSYITNLTEQDEIEKNRNKNKKKDCSIEAIIVDKVFPPGPKYAEIVKYNIITKYHRNRKRRNNNNKNNNNNINFLENNESDIKIKKINNNKINIANKKKSINNINSVKNNVLDNKNNSFKQINKKSFILKNNINETSTIIDNKNLNKDNYFNKNLFKKINNNNENILGLNFINFGNNNNNASNDTQLVNPYLVNQQLLLQQQMIKNRVNSNNNYNSNFSNNNNYINQNFYCNTNNLITAPLNFKNANNINIKNGMNNEISGFIYSNDNSNNNNNYNASTSNKLYVNINNILPDKNKKDNYNKFDLITKMKNQIQSQSNHNDNDNVILANLKSVNNAINAKINVNSYINVNNNSNKNNTYINNSSNSNNNNSNNNNNNCVINYFLQNNILDKVSSYNYSYSKNTNSNKTNSYSSNNYTNNNCNNNTSNNNNTNYNNNFGLQNNISNYLQNKSDNNMNNIKEYVNYNNSFVNSNNILRNLGNNNTTNNILYQCNNNKFTETRRNEKNNTEMKIYPYVLFSNRKDSKFFPDLCN